jgi:hypothetical protein
MIISLIMRLAQKHIANPPNLLEEFKKHQKKEEQHLLKTLEIVKNTPSLQKMTTYFDDGRGKVYKELDVLKDKENRLEQLRKEMDMLGQNENEYFRKSFADDFFVNLTFLRKNKKDGNEALKKMAETLLEEKRSVLSNLESVVEKLGGE